MKYDLRKKIKKGDSVNVVSDETVEHGNVELDEQVERRRYSCKRLIIDALYKGKSKGVMMRYNKSMSCICQGY